MIGPLAAIACGILVARFVPFHILELFAAIGAFAALSVVARLQAARTLAMICCWLGLIPAGALTALLHAPGPPPELDAEGREIVILGGCVVEPPAVSGERERFLLELDPRRARAGHALHQARRDAAAAALRAEHRAGRARAQAAQFRQSRARSITPHFLARQDIYWTASGARRHGARAARAAAGRVSKRR